MNNNTKEQFINQILKIYQKKSSNSRWFSEEEYLYTLGRVDFLKSNICIEKEDYRFRKMYDILNIGGVKQLISIPVSYLVYLMTI